MRSLCGPYVLAEFLDEAHGVLKRDRRLLAEEPFQRAEIRRLTEWFLQKMEKRRHQAPGARACLQIADDRCPRRRTAGLKTSADRPVEHSPAYEVSRMACRVAHLDRR